MRSRMRLRSASTLTPLGLAAVLTACTGSPQPPLPVPVVPIPARVAATRPAPVMPPAVNPLEGTSVEIPKYEPNGRRDPFEVYEVRDGGGLTVSSTRLTGIVRNSRSALALLEAPDGIGYILRAGDTLGDGKLMDIGLDNVVFAVSAKPGAPATRVVLRLLAN
jgi:Tfp pilus assembly protein PilP